MTSVTNTDLLYCAKYTTNVLNNFIITTENFDTSLYQTKIEEWKIEDLPNLQHPENLLPKYIHNLTNNGCSTVFCRSFKYNGDPCLPTDELQKWETIENEPRYYESCQSACYNINKSWDKENPAATMFSTKYEASTERCLLRNLFADQYALAPANRSDDFVKGVTNVPTFNFKNEDEMLVTKKYCEWFGASYENNDCVRPTHYFREMLFGKSLSFLIFRRGSYSSRIPYYTRVTTLNKIAKKNLVLLQTPNQPILVKDVKSDGFWDDYTNIETILNILRDMGFDVLTDSIIDVIRYGIKQLLKRIATDVIFNNLVKLGTTKLIGAVISSTIIRRTIVDMALTSIKSIAYQAVRILGLVVDIIDIVFTIVTIASIILDILDIFGLNKLLFQSNLDEISKQFDVLLRQAFETNEPEITPAVLIQMTRLSPTDPSESINDTTETDNELIFSLEQAALYLKNLDVNSLGQRVDWNEGQAGTELSRPIADIIDSRNNITLGELNSFNEANKIYMKRYTLVLIPSISFTIALLSYFYSKTMSLIFLIICLIFLILQISIIELNQFSFTRTIRYFDTKQGQGSLQLLQSRLKYFNMQPHNITLTSTMLRQALFEINKSF